MNIKSSEWFEVVCAYDRIGGDGNEENAKELYLIEASTFSEAEQRVLSELASLARGDIDVLQCKRQKYKTVFFADQDCETWYKAKVVFLYIDEKTEKEMKRKEQFVVNAHNVTEVEHIINTNFTDEDTKVDKVESVDFIDAFFHKKAKTGD